MAKKLAKFLLVLSFLFLPLSEVGKFQFNSISFTINDIFIFSTILVYLYIFKEKIFKKAFLMKPILIFILIAFLSLFTNSYWIKFNELGISLLYLFRWILYALIYFIVLKLDKPFVNKLKYFLLVPISIFLAGGYIQYLFYPNLRNLYYLGWDEHLYRLFSSFLDPNFAGAFFVLSFFYLAYLLTISLKNRIIFAGVTVISIFDLIAIYLTYSRSALIMLFVAALVYFILLGKKRILLLFILVLFLLVFVSPKAFQTEGTNLLRVASSEARVESAKNALVIFEKHPILGVGFNAYRYAQHEEDFLSDKDWQTSHSGAGTDNSYLFILATTGIIGAVSYFYLLFNLIRLPSKNKNLKILLITSMTGILVNSFFINSLFYVFVMEWMWIIAAFTESS